MKVANKGIVTKLVLVTVNKVQHYAKYTDKKKTKLNKKNPKTLINGLYTAIEPL